MSFVRALGSEIIYSAGYNLRRFGNRFSFVSSVGIGHKWARWAARLRESFSVREAVVSARVKRSENVVLQRFLQPTETIDQLIWVRVWPAWYVWAH